MISLFKDIKVISKILYPNSVATSIFLCDLCTYVTVSLEFIQKNGMVLSKILELSISFLPV